MLQMPSPAVDAFRVWRRHWPAWPVPSAGLGVAAGVWLRELRGAPAVTGHGGPVEEPPQDVFLSDDPALAMVHAPMASWLQAHPCDCHARCECDDWEEDDRW